MNLYAYVGNAPVELIDPLGLQYHEFWMFKTYDEYRCDHFSQRWLIEHSNISISFLLINVNYDGAAYFEPLGFGISGDYSFGKKRLGPADSHAHIFFRNLGIGFDYYEESNRGCPQDAERDGVTIHIGLGAGLPAWVGPYVGNIFIFF
jgi:hypothetical protein